MKMRRQLLRKSRLEVCYLCNLDEYVGMCHYFLYDYDLCEA